MVKTGGLVVLVLRDGTTLEGWELLRKGRRSVTVGYDGHAEDPAVDPAVIGERRIILREDIREITPVG